MFWKFYFILSFEISDLLLFEISYPFLMKFMFKFQKNLTFFIIKSVFVILQKVITITSKLSSSIPSKFLIASMFWKFSFLLCFEFFYFLFSKISFLFLF